MGDTRIVQTTPAQLTPPNAWGMPPPMDVHRTVSASHVPRITPEVVVATELQAMETRIIRGDRITSMVTSQQATLVQVTLADAHLTVTTIVALDTGLRGPAATFMLEAPALVTALLVIVDQPVVGMESLVIPDQTLTTD